MAKIIMRYPARTFFKIIGVILIFIIIGISCNKNDLDHAQVGKENIDVTEILSWNSYYHKTFPSGPTLVLSKAEKLFHKNKFYVRIPMSSGEGSLYFTKSTVLEVIFFRILPNDPPIKFPFSGNYEIFDLNRLILRKIVYDKGKYVKTIKYGTKPNSVNDSGIGIKTNRTWVQQFFYCISKYILAVPARDETGDWGACLGVGSDYQEKEEILSSLNSGGAELPEINWNFFFANLYQPYTGLNPQPIWSPYANILIPNPSTPPNPEIDSFDNLDNPIDAPEEAEIENGIEISEVEDTTSQQYGRVIGYTRPRGNTEDMEYGTNGNGTGIYTPLLSLSNNELFNLMKNLFGICTVFNSELSIVGDELIQKVRNNAGGSYSSTVLNDNVSQSITMINFMKKFGNLLNTQLSSVGGDINSIPQIELPDRPQFSNSYHLFHGLKILINDTEYTTIQISDYTIDAFGRWSAIITFKIYDHFGLDKADTIKYQGMHTGFAAW